MERVHQSLSADGLQIPLSLMRQYGLAEGSGVTLELEPDGIRIVAARPDRTTIENRALRYLLTTVGDAATVLVKPLPDDQGWQADVYALDSVQPIGQLIYSITGALSAERSTSPADLRRAARHTPPAA